MENKKKIIIPTGYMGSGSSAITDLFSEVEGVNASRGTFEYVFMHCPNGIFDLEDKLLTGNNAVRSDEALHSFAATMKQLYDKKYWWVGHYNVNIGPDFWKVTQEYINELIEFVPDFYWYYQENVTWKMVPRLIVKRIVRILTGGKVNLSKVLSYSPMWLSFITADRFYEVTQQYIYRLMDMLGLGKESIVLDQLLLPFNLYRMENYFKDDAEVFVVERDPRDVFISNKYFWAKQDATVPYPTDVRKFCDYYRKIRRMEKPTDNPHVHRIRFEDMIYRYEETIGQIFDSLGWDQKAHTRKKEMFVPERSINNTQLFLQNDAYREESEVIASELSDYIYSFPYDIRHNAKEVF